MACTSVGVIQSRVKPQSNELNRESQTRRAGAEELYSSIA
jgi:hypothetical protein